MSTYVLKRDIDRFLHPVVMAEYHNLGTLNIQDIFSTEYFVLCIWRTQSPGSRVKRWEEAVLCIVLNKTESYSGVPGISLLHSVGYPRVPGVSPPEIFQSMSGIPGYVGYRLRRVP